MLPVTNIQDLIDKKDAWLLWTYDDTRVINDFNIYDFSRGKSYGVNKSYNYVKMSVSVFSDWGASYNSWEACTLADVLFKFGFKERLSEEALYKFFNSLSLIREWRKDVIMYMGFINMIPYYSDYRE